MVESIKSWGLLVLTQFQAHLGDLESQLTDVEQKLAVVQAQDDLLTADGFTAADHKRLYEEQLEQSTEQLTELRKVLTQELDAKRVSLSCAS